MLGRRPRPAEQTGWSDPPSGPRLLSRRGVQIVLGTLWLFDALLQAEPSNFSRSYPLGSLAQSVMGGPGWENHLVFAGLRPFAAHWPWWNLAVVALQATIGLCLLTGRQVRLALGVSVLWAAVIWVLGEGFGMLPTGFAQLLFGAPGSAALYGLLAVLAWPRAAKRDLDPTTWRVAWSVLWLGAAILELPAVYSPGVSLAANFEESSIGQRSLLVHLSHGTAAFALAHPVLFTAVLAAVQAVIGLAVWCDPARLRLWLGLAIGISLAYWVIGQALGGILSEGATDPGTAPLVIALALAGWPRRQTQGVVSSLASTWRACSSESLSTLSSG
jgi:hypothetical protein